MQLLEKMQDFLAQKKKIMTAPLKLNETFLCHFSRNLIKTCLQKTLSGSFQYRLLMKSIPTNIQLQKWKIKESSNCSFCDSEKETFAHLFIYCPISNFFWRKVKEEYNLTFDIEEKTILLNKAHCNPKRIDNFIMLLAKFFIHRTRCLGKKLNFIQFKEYVQSFKDIEEFIAKNNDKFKQHCEKWNTLLI